MSARALVGAGLLAAALFDGCAIETASTTPGASRTESSTPAAKAPTSAPPTASQKTVDPA